MGPATAAAAAAREVLWGASCMRPCRLAGVAVSALCGRCADVDAVAAAVKLLGSCLQLQLQLHRLQEAGGSSSSAGGGSSSAASGGCQAAAAVAAEAWLQPQGAELLSGAVGWQALLAQVRHPHPRVRAAVLRALNQVGRCMVVTGR